MEVPPWLWKPPWLSRSLFFVGMWKPPFQRVHHLSWPFTASHLRGLSVLASGMQDPKLGGISSFHWEPDGKCRRIYQSHTGENMVGICETNIRSPRHAKTRLTVSVSPEAWYIAMSPRPTLVSLNFLVLAEFEGTPWTTKTPERTSYPLVNIQKAIENGHL